MLSYDDYTALVDAVPLVYNPMVIEIDTSHEGKNPKPYGDGKVSSHVDQLNHGAHF